MRRLALLAAFVLAITPGTLGFSVNTEADCLARNIYHEARGASRLDERAVAHVTINRRESLRFPQTICGVVRQPGQFSWVGRSSRISDPVSWDRAKRTAEAALSGNSSDPTHGATYFWNRSVSPSWGRRMTVTLRTEDHTYARRG